VKIDFEFETNYGVFRDALHFPDGFELPGEEELNQLKLNRLNNWLAIVAEPPVEEPQTE
jgi:hypothetical protein